ncbi:hypothetical protein EVAR_48231_1 [Eumeta japonica]|uniref:Uncharacterized protein n=1 Tax=Eumeta variegata TaxID=151549 RepID=A0A4C1YH95_EUMVA|nr:hypothetical protein EVAR_48231_1 [Eumeta japonica]
MHARIDNFLLEFVHEPPRAPEVACCCERLTQLHTFSGKADKNSTTYYFYPIETKEMTRTREKTRPQPKLTESESRPRNPFFLRPRTKGELLWPHTRAPSFGV